MGNRPYIWQGNEETHDYDDIIELPHSVSSTRPHMSMLDRAAQFSPYDALNGYSEEISETSRRTEKRIELSAQEREALNRKLARLDALCRQAAHERFEGKAAELPEVSVTYFVPDSQLHRGSRKSGGAHLTRLGQVRRIDLANQVLTMAGEKSGMDLQIRLADILELSGECLEGVYAEALGYEPFGTEES